MKVFVGYDPREDIAYQVCKHSILNKQPNADVRALKQQELRDAGWYNRPIDKLASTEFTFTRFLVPELANFKGWAVFMDCDMILTTDIKELFDQADDKYAVMCVQHDYTPKEGMKMDGQKQTIYPRKNWSSVVLFNCAHPSNARLTQDMVNDPELNGAYFHRFSWLKDEEIGELEHTWNYLVGVYDDIETPKLIHYTDRMSKMLSKSALSHFKSSKTIKKRYNFDNLNDYYDKIKIAHQVKNKLLEDVNFEKYLKKTPKSLQHTIDEFSSGLSDYINNKELTNNKFDKLPIKINNSFLKLWEILDTFKLISHNASKFKVLHLCEAPGQMIVCTRYWVEQNCEKLSANFIGIYLN